jgi:hypothetical protein
MVRLTATEAQSQGIKPEDGTLHPKIYPSDERKKAHAGTVKVEVFKERLRLRWRYLGERYCLSLPIGSRSVESAVRQIDQPLQLTGAQWNPVNVNRMLALRCNYISGSLNSS